MRDAFGGAFMIRLFLVFIFIYMFFTAIALNYAKAYKVKNRVIDYLEDNEIGTIRDMNAEEEKQMEDFFEMVILDDLNYRVTEAQMKCDGEYQEVYCSHGIKIDQIDPKNIRSDNMGTYYHVETYFTWNLGFLTKLLALGSNNPNGDVSRGVWTISGETRTIIKKQSR